MPRRLNGRSEERARAAGADERPATWRRASCRPYFAVRPRSQTGLLSCQHMSRREADRHQAVDTTVRTHAALHDGLVEAEPEADPDASKRWLPAMSTCCGVQRLNGPREVAVNLRRGRSLQHAIAQAKQTIIEDVGTSSILSAGRLRINYADG